ncbi:NAD(P)-binding protein [Clavulina sp. PMI_390]|nr:NAD(P)-binding protein [Clavulina sp. PMI_390]
MTIHFRAEEAVKPIREENPRVDIQVVQLDLTSEASIRAAAAKIISFGHLIDVLINNAAPIVRDEKQAFTENQFEIQIGGSYFGHFLFTSLLFPRLLPTAGPEENRKPRVINVTSIAAFFNAPMRWDDIHFTKRPEDYDRYAAYNQSKTALGLFSVALAERFGKAGLLSFSADPGSMLPHLHGT